MSANSEAKNQRLRLIRIKINGHNDSRTSIGDFSGKNANLGETKTSEESTLQMPQNTANFREKEKKFLEREKWCYGKSL